MVSAVTNILDALQLHQRMARATPIVPTTPLWYGKMQKGESYEYERRGGGARSGRTPIYIGDYWSELTYWSVVTMEKPGEEDHGQEAVAQNRHHRPDRHTLCAH